MTENLEIDVWMVKTIKDLKGLKATSIKSEELPDTWVEFIIGDFISANFDDNWIIIGPRIDCVIKCTHERDKVAENFGPGLPASMMSDRVLAGVSQQHGQLLEIYWSQAKGGFIRLWEDGENTEEYLDTEDDIEPQTNEALRIFFGLSSMEEFIVSMNKCIGANDVESSWD